MRFSIIIDGKKLFLSKSQNQDYIADLFLIWALSLFRIMQFTAVKTKAIS